MNLRTTCPACSSTRLKSKPFGYQFKGRWLGGRECVDCGIIFLDPQPTNEELTEMYSKEYFEGDFRCGHAGSYFDSDSLDRLVNTSLLETFFHSPHVTSAVSNVCGSENSTSSLTVSEGPSCDSVTARARFPFPLLSEGRGSR